MRVSRAESFFHVRSSLLLFSLNGTTPKRPLDFGPMRRVAGRWATIFDVVREISGRRPIIAGGLFIGLLFIGPLLIGSRKLETGGVMRS